MMQSVYITLLFPEKIGLRPQGVGIRNEVSYLSSDNQSMYYDWIFLAQAW